MSKSRAGEMAALAEILGVGEGRLDVEVSGG